MKYPFDKNLQMYFLNILTFFKLWNYSHYSIKILVKYNVLNLDAYNTHLHIVHSVFLKIKSEEKVVVEFCKARD